MAMMLIRTTYSPNEGRTQFSQFARHRTDVACTAPEAEGEESSESCNKEFKSLGDILHLRLLLASGIYEGLHISPSSP